MHVITGQSFQEVYRQCILVTLRDGKVVSPRGKKTYELSPATLVIEDARKLVTMPSERKGNHTFQLAEMFWMMRGSDDLEEIAHYNAVWRYFEDEDNKGILNGAYGARLRDWAGHLDQFTAVYHKLLKDEHSRQAVMIIFDPERDNLIHEDGNYSKDIPCTNYFVFTIREGKLNMMTVMRSNDIHKGTIYDIPNFLTFQNILAGWLNVEVGKYTHVANSLHIYEDDVENLIDVFNETQEEVYDKDYGDPRLSVEEFNTVMPLLAAIEQGTRLEQTKEQFDEIMTEVLEAISVIENTWWKSVAAQIAMYNYRKLGASTEEFQIFLPYITNEYRRNCEKWVAIKK